MKTVVLGVSGGIAAYKSAELVSRFVKQGLQVYVVMTRHATEFITPLTLETLSNRPVAADMFADKPNFEIEHISLAKRADMFVVAPATANVIAKMAHGIADDMLTSTLLATRAPILVAPAMNENMWEHPATQQNMQTLRARGAHIIGPGKGMLACGDIGYGRMEQPETIVEATLALLEARQDYQGKRLVITAGPTQERLDPVRFLSNHSSGKMGFALAQAAAERGADVTLVHGPVHLTAPAGVKAMPVVSTEDMLNAVLAEYESCDMVIKAAAPADFKPEIFSEGKIKKHEQSDMTLRMIANPDILTTLSKMRKQQVLVGFAAETDNLAEYAQDKLQRKGLDMIVANDVTRTDVGFQADTNAVTVYKPGGYVREYEAAPKLEIANHILDEAAGLFKA